MRLRKVGIMGYLSTCSYMTNVMQASCSSTPTVTFTNCTSVQNALCRYVEDEQKKREAANDAWVFSLARGKWEHVKYASGDVPRVRLPCISTML